MTRRYTLIAAIGFAVACTPMAWAQPPGGGPRGPGMMHGAGPGMMITDPAAYLEGLKHRLGITAEQEGAWSKYAGVVTQHATQMHAARAHMFESMNTATWMERRDMMHRAMEERRESQDAIHAAAETLLPSLSAAQKTQAASILPGLRSPMMGGGMMGRGRP